MHVSLISVTQALATEDLPQHLQGSPEALIAYCARVSSPNPDNTHYESLIAYCLKHKHWSPFEMIDLTVKIETSRAISQQILRHRSFVFQEFSQRYSEVTSGVELYEAREQDQKNRQNSIDALPEEDKEWFITAQKRVHAISQLWYKQALKKGIAKECSRFLLPLNTKTTLFMKGSVRSWIHYLEVRCDPSTQKEHRDIALAVKNIFIEQFPTISKSLNWEKGAL